jgi:hypothetical protein
VGFIPAKAGIEGQAIVVALGPRLRGGDGLVIAEENCYRCCGGTGMPGIFTLTEPKWLRLVK